MIGAVQKAVSILKIISEEKNKPVTLSDISKKAEINKSTCSHIISTLAEEGFIKRISHSQGYVLGPEAYCLSRFGQYDGELVAVCRPVLKWLHKKIEYTVILAVIESGKKFTIDHIEPSEKILTESCNIMPDDIYRTATGRIIMANMDISEVEEVFKKNGVPPAGHWDGIATLSDLKASLFEIDRKSVVKTMHKRENSDSFSIGCAAAIFRYRKCVGAIGAAANVSESDLKEFWTKEKDMEKCILTARNEIGRRLKYS